MPPKKSRFSILSKHLDEEDTSDNLNTKKSIEQPAPSNAKDYLAELGKIISESTESKSFSLEINSIAD